MNTPTTAPQLPPEPHLQQLQQLAHRALSHWQLEAAEISLIKYRENAVYRVVTHDGQRYALRIHRPGYHSDRALLSELQWMAALAESGIQVPEVIATAGGQLMITEQLPSLPNRYQIDLFGWIEGQPLGSVEHGLNSSGSQIHTTYQAIGEIAAHLHNQASQWTLPAGFQRHAWDADGLVGEQPFWGRFWELASLSPEQQRLLIDARDQVRKALADYDRSPDRYGLIHADFVPENLMVDGNTTDNNRLRLIDFDDAGFGWHMFELATALYFIRDNPDYHHARSALIKGYRQHRPLTEGDINKLELFLTARGFTYLGWIADRQETETARKLAPDLIRRACEQATRYLAAG